MKTNYFSSQKLSIYSIIGLFTLAITSCGSYQNKSYYDNDGVYGAQTVKKEKPADATENKYQEYFSSLNKENQEVFTNVEDYSTYTDTVNKKTETEQYDSWGSNSSDDVTVNVYGNNWGYGYWNNYYFGQNMAWNSWYYPSFYGFYGSPYWGYNNWNNWYGYNAYNPYCGYGYYGNPYWYGNGYYNNYYGNSYAYSNGPRQRNRYSGKMNDENSNRRVATVTPTRNTISPRNNITTPREYNSTPRSTTSTPRQYNSTPRSTTSTPREYNNTPRTNPVPRENPAPRNTNVTPRENPTPRSYEPSSPRTNDSPRSYSPSSSSGSSSGGGTRSSGGGRR